MLFARHTAALLVVTNIATREQQQPDVRRPYVSVGIATLKDFKKYFFESIREETIIYIFGLSELPNVTMLQSQVTERNYRIGAEKKKRITSNLV